MKLTRLLLILLVAPCVPVFADEPHVFGSYPSQWHAYINKDYGFKIYYPASLKPNNQFSSAYLLGAGWSMGSPDNTKNNPYQHSVLEIPLQNSSGIGKDGDQYYYQYYIRVGASTYPADIAHCEKPRNNFDPNSDYDTIVINHNRFHLFTFSDAAMSQYNSGLSYRILSRNICYSIESVETGSNSSNIPDYAEMNEKNQALARKIIYSFRFIKRG